MNILYLHQYFKTPDIPGGTRSYWNSLELIKRGHRVTVIRYDKSIDKRVERRTVDGINLITVRINYSQSMGIFSRLKAFVAFMLYATWLAMKEKNIDFVIATSTPLTIGFPALVLKKLKGIPYLFEVRDLWPEVPIQMGGLNNKLAIRVARWFEHTIYSNASHIVALSPGMEAGVLDAGTPPEKVSMIPNMAKIDKFWSREPDKALMEELRLSAGTFKVIYFGAMGEANAIEYILDAAALLKSHKDIEFLFIGNGSRQTMVMERKEAGQLDNVRYLGLFNMEKTSELVNICDVSLVTFSNIPILATNSPNKLFDSLSAGKPIIVNSNGWTKALVEENECGIFVDPESPQDFVDKLLKLKAAPALLEKMGRNARMLAENQYDKSILCDQFVKAVNKVAV